MVDARLLLAVSLSSLDNSNISHTHQKLNLGQRILLLWRKIEPLGKALYNATISRGEQQTIQWRRRRPNSGAT